MIEASLSCLTECLGNFFFEALTPSSFEGGGAGSESGKKRVPEGGWAGGDLARHCGHLVMGTDCHVDHIFRRKTGQVGSQNRFKTP